MDINDEMDEFVKKLTEWVSENKGERATIVVTFENFGIGTFINGSRENIVNMLASLLLDKRNNFAELMEEGARIASLIGRNELMRKLVEKSIEQREKDEEEDDSEDMHVNKDGKILS